MCRLIHRQLPPEEQSSKPRCSLRRYREVCPQKRRAFSSEAQAPHGGPALLITIDALAHYSLTGYRRISVHLVLFGGPMVCCPGRRRLRLCLGDRHGALRRRGPVRSVDPPGDGGPDEREDRRRLIAVPEGKRVTCISGW